MIIEERIARYQRERELVYLRWYRTGEGRDRARAAVRMITGWIERMAGYGQQIQRKNASN